MNINKWWDKHGNGVVGGVDFLGQAINTMLYNGPSSNELLSDAGMSNRTINGVGYQVYNNINRDEVMNLEHKTNVSNTLGLIGKGATAGSAFGPWGAAAGAAIGGIAGLFAGGHAHRETNRALADAYNRAWHTDIYNHSVAATEGLLGDLANEYGDMRNLFIKSSALGTEAGNSLPKLFGKKQLIESSNGYVFAEPNSETDTFEPTYNRKTLRGHVIRGGVPGKDNAPFYDDGDTTVFSYNELIGTGKLALPLVLQNELIWKKIDSNKGANRELALKVAKPELENIDSQLQILEDVQSDRKRLLGIGQGYKMKRMALGEETDGNLNEVVVVGNNPRRIGAFNFQEPTLRYSWDDVKGQINNTVHGMEQWYLANPPKTNNSISDVPENSNNLGWGNFLAFLGGAGVGISLYLDATRLKIKTPDTYTPNTEAGRAYKSLSEIKVNPLPLLRGADVDAATMRHKLLSSGATAALKYIGGIATDALSQANKANLAAGVQQMNNQYKAAEANARLEYGMKEAINRMQSKQWDLDYTSKAHASKLAGKQLGIQNTLKALEQYIANINKLGMFRDMYGLYNMDIKSRTA